MLTRAHHYKIILKSSETLRMLEAILISQFTFGGYLDHFQNFSLSIVKDDQIGWKYWGQRLLNLPNETHADIESPCKIIKGGKRWEHSEVISS